MTKKHLRDIAIVIFAIFLITIIVYPLIFSTDRGDKKTPIGAPPVNTPTEAPAPAQ